jgi:hypothetical protein
VQVHTVGRVALRYARRSRALRAVLVRTAWLVVPTTLVVVVQRVTPVRIGSRGLGMYLVTYRAALATDSVLAGLVPGQLGIQTLAFSDIGFFRHWLFQTLAFSDIGFFRKRHRSFSSRTSGRAWSRAITRTFCATGPVGKGRRVL